MASILHHGIHHKCLNLVSHGVEKMKIINLCKLERFVGWNPHSEHPSMIRLHLYLYTMTALNIMVPTISVSTLSAMA